MALGNSETIVPVSTVQSVVRIKVLDVRHIAQLKLLAKHVRIHGGGYVFGVDPIDPPLSRC